MSTIQPPDLDPDWLQARIHRMLGDEGPIDPDEDLTLYGLDSMAVMRLLLMLEERGVILDFAELLARPTLNAWQELIRRRTN